MNVGKLLIERFSLIVPFLALGFGAELAPAQLYEADTSSGRILEFTTAGVESTFASNLSAPVGVAFDATGNLFVSASGNGKILEFASDAVKSTFASGLEQPAGLAFDANGNLFVAASGAGEILKFTPGAVKSTFASGLSKPSSVVFDAFGNLFVGTSTGVAGAGEILKFAPSGAKSTFATGLFTPTGLAFAANGNLYVADNGTAHIYEFTPAGVQSTFASVSTFGLAFDAFGDLFSSDDGNRIQKIGPGGAVTTFATGLSHSGLMAFAPFTTLHSFDGSDGGFPGAGLTQASNGDLYGTTAAGGTSNQGTVFKITSTGSLTTLYTFCVQSGCTDGNQPGAALVQAANGDLYGTTLEGGGRQRRDGLQNHSERRADNSP